MSRKGNCINWIYWTWFFYYPIGKSNPPFLESTGFTFCGPKQIHFLSWFDPVAKVRNSIFWWIPTRSRGVRALKNNSPSHYQHGMWIRRCFSKLWGTWEPPKLLVIFGCGSPKTGRYPKMSSLMGNKPIIFYIFQVWHQPWPWPTWGNSHSWRPCLWGYAKTTYHFKELLPYRAPRA